MTGTDSPMRAMILAAGRGQRMGVLTADRPKPLLEVGGRSLLDWHLRALARAGYRDVVINLAWQAAQIPAALGNGERYGLQIAYSDEGDEALETAGGIRRALPRLGDAPFLVVNGDVWCDVDFARLPPLEPNATAALMLVPNPAHHPQGDFSLDVPCGQSGLAWLASEGRTGERPRYTYSGIGIFRPEFFAEIPAGRVALGPCLHRAASNRRVLGFVYHGNWVDVGTPERLRLLDERLAAGAVG